MDISALTVQIIPITTILKNIAVLYARLLLVQIIPITTILKNMPIYYFFAVTFK